jgi:putative nucleotidyltransferase with HDIG domain
VPGPADAGRLGHVALDVELGIRKPTRADEASVVLSRQDCGSQTTPRDLAADATIPAVTSNPAEALFRETISVLIARSVAERACIYLISDTGDFDLISQLGYPARALPPAGFTKSHAILECVNHYRKPFFFNTPREAGPLRIEMERTGTLRLLVGPLYEEGRLVGVVEARDKPAGELFFQEDLKLMDSVVEDVARLRRAVLGIPEPASTREEAVPLSGGAPPPPPAFHHLAGPPAAPPQAASPPVPVPLADSAERPPMTQREAILFRAFAATSLLDPDVAAVVFSLWTDSGAEFYIGSRRPLADDARDAAVASARGVAERLRPGRGSGGEHFNIEFPLGRGDVEFPGSSIAAAQTSAAVAEESRAILFTILLEREPESGREAANRDRHLLVRQVLQDARGSDRYREAYRGLVRAFLEPGIKKYSGLVAHSLSVARLSRRFAHAVGWSETEVEQVAVAGLLHDVGIRELSPETLCTRRPLSESEYRLARDHPSVGAMLLSGIEFPYPIVPLVLHHHERFDGSGYPDRLKGDQIPPGSRLIHIVEAYDAMTSAHSYRMPIESSAALQIIVSKAGTQFDPDLAPRFQEFVRSGGAE